MSLLFRALDKASREYSSEQAPAYVPLVRLHSRYAPSFVTFRMAAFAGLLLLSGLIGYHMPRAQNVVRPAFPDVVRQQAPDSANKPAIQAFEENKDEGGIRLASVTPPTLETDPAALTKIESEINRSKALQISDDDLWSPEFEGEPVVQTKNKLEATYPWYDRIEELQRKASRESLTQLEQLADKHPNVAALHAARAVVMSRLGDAQGSLSAWKMATSLDPKNEEYRLGLAVTYDKLDMKKDALAQYKMLPMPLNEQISRRIDYLGQSDLADNSSMVGD